MLETGVAHQGVVTVQPSYFGGYRVMCRQLARPVLLEQLSVASVDGDMVMHGRFAWGKSSSGTVTTVENSVCAQDSADSEGGGEGGFLKNSGGSSESVAADEESDALGTAAHVTHDDMAVAAAIKGKRPYVRFL